MLNGKEISNYEKGMLTGTAIGAVLGPSFTLMLFCLIICYDLGRPQIIDVGQRALARIIGLKKEGSQPNQMTEAINKLKELDPDTIDKIVKMGFNLVGNGGDEEECQN